MKAIYLILPMVFSSHLLAAGVSQRCLSWESENFKYYLKNNCNKTLQVYYCSNYGGLTGTQCSKKNFRSTVIGSGKYREISTSGSTSLAACVYPQKPIGWTGSNHRNYRCN